MHARTLTLILPIPLAANKGEVVAATKMLMRWHIDRTDSSPVEERSVGK